MPRRGGNRAGCGPRVPRTAGADDRHNDARSAALCTRCSALRGRTTALTVRAASARSFRATWPARRRRQGRRALRRPGGQWPIRGTGPSAVSRAARTGRRAEHQLPVCGCGPTLDRAGARLLRLRRVRNFRQCGRGNRDARRSYPKALSGALVRAGAVYALVGAAAYWLSARYSASSQHGHGAAMVEPGWVCGGPYGTPREAPLSRNREPAPRASATEIRLLRGAGVHAISVMR